MRIYKNGSATGTERTTTSQTYIAYYETFTVAAGDNIQLYVLNTGTAGTTYIRNFIVRYIDTLMTVVTD